MAEQTEQAQEQSGAGQAADETSAPDGANPSRADDRLAPFGDIPLELDVQLDRRRVSVREALDLDRGSLIRLDRPTGENVELLLNGVLAGAGEIVVIDDMVGLRITHIYAERTRGEGSWHRHRS